VAASLNGGNSLALFVKTLQQWAHELGFSVPQGKIQDLANSYNNYKKQDI
jgi:sedoheptulokinase